MSGDPRNRFGFISKDPHADGRGWVLNPFDHLASAGAITNCHAFSVEPGCSRGRHAHPGRDEQVAVLAGELAIVDLETGHEETLSPSRPGLLTIPPGIPHVFENRSAGTAVALCFSTGLLDGSLPDTVRL